MARRQSPLHWGIVVLEAAPNTQGFDPNQPECQQGTCFCLCSTWSWLHLFPMAVITIAICRNFVPVPKITRHVFWCIGSAVKSVLWPTKVLFLNGEVNFPGGWGWPRSVELKLDKSDNPISSSVENNNLDPTKQEGQNFWLKNKKLLGILSVSRGWGHPLQ